MVDFIIRRGRDKANVNLFPCASITQQCEGKLMTEFGLLSGRGIVGFSDVNKTIQNTELMARIMNYASDIGVLIMQHAEDYELSKNSCINDGEIATRLGLQGVSALAEKIIIERDLSLLSEYPCRYHINQISSKQSLDVIKKNKNNGKQFSAGVSINNLALNENDIGDFKTFLKLSPPLRLEEDRLALVQGVKDGLIDVIVSDHLPEDEESKRLPFAQAATGAIGVETLLPLSLEMYHNESLPLNKIIETLTINPSKILKINKGSLAKGSDGDICIFDLEAPWAVQADKLKSKSKNTAIEVRNLQGKVLMTYLNGELVYSV
jgi:dihydroorotase